MFLKVSAKFPQNTQNNQNTIFKVDPMSIGSISYLWLVINAVWPAQPAFLAGTSVVQTVPSCGSFIRGSLS